MLEGCSFTSTRQTKASHSKTVRKKTFLELENGLLFLLYRKLMGEATVAHDVSLSWNVNHLHTSSPNTHAADLPWFWFFSQNIEFLVANSADKTKKPENNQTNKSEEGVVLNKLLLIDITISQ